MKQVGGVWLPDHEVHMVEWMRKRNQIVDGKLTYQYHKLEAAMKFVKQFRRAVDVGAHCGFWSMHLVKRFEHVIAFEPVAEHRACFRANLPDVPNCELVDCALGAEPGMVNIRTTVGSSGDSWVKGDGDIPMRTLDSFALEPVDFIKLDCEGYEYFALHGGEEMLKRDRPCVMVEQKRDFATRFGLRARQAVEYLQGLGAKQRAEIGGDYCMVWD